MDAKQVVTNYHNAWTGGHGHQWRVVPTPAASISVVVVGAGVTTPGHSRCVPSNRLFDYFLLGQGRSHTPFLC